MAVTPLQQELALMERLPNEIFENIVTQLVWTAPKDVGLAIKYKQKLSQTSRTMFSKLSDPHVEWSFIRAVLNQHGDLSKPLIEKIKKPDIRRCFQTYIRESQLDKIYEQAKRVLIATYETFRDVRDYFRLDSRVKFYFSYHDLPKFVKDITHSQRRAHTDFMLYCNFKAVFICTPFHTIVIRVLDLNTDPSLGSISMAACLIRLLDATFKGFCKRDRLDTVSTHIEETKGIEEASVIYAILLSKTPGRTIKCLSARQFAQVHEQLQNQSGIHNIFLSRSLSWHTVYKIERVMEGKVPRAKDEHTSRFWGSTAIMQVISEMLTPRRKASCLPTKTPGFPLF